MWNTGNKPTCSSNWAGSIRGEKNSYITNWIGRLPFSWSLPIWIKKMKKYTALHFRMYEGKNQDRSTNINLQRLHTCGFCFDVKKLVLEPVPRLLRTKMHKQLSYACTFPAWLLCKLCFVFPSKQLNGASIFPQLGKTSELPQDK